MMEKGALMKVLRATLMIPLGVEVVALGAEEDLGEVEEEEVEVEEEEDQEHVLR